LGGEDLGSRFNAMKRFGDSDKGILSCKLELPDTYFLFCVVGGKPE